VQRLTKHGVWVSLALLFPICGLAPASRADAPVASAAVTASLAGVKLSTVLRSRVNGHLQLYDGSLLSSGDHIDALAYVATEPRDTNGMPLADVVALTDTAGGVKRAQADAKAPSSAMGYAWINCSHTGMRQLDRLFEPTAVMDGTAERALGAPRILKRKSTVCAYPIPAAGEKLVSARGGGVTVSSNANAGGSVWEWWWHGNQFINDFDYGRQLSMAVYYESGEALQETGDKYGTGNINAAARHPSPTAYVSTSRSAHQSTRSVPLEWVPDQHGGGPANPVIYLNVTIGKELALNWTGPDGRNRNWPVAMYESVYDGPFQKVANVEAPTAYLNSRFSRYYKYDPATDQLQAIDARQTKVNVSGGGADGLILASGKGLNAVAMGIYKNDPNAGIVLYDDTRLKQGKYGPHFSKWGVIYRGEIQAGWTFQTWIVTDTVENIKRDFQQLFSWGVSSRKDPASSTGK
jgi:hypothetical protein